jgi:hypothetical protein
MDSLVLWMESQQTGPKLVGVIRSYLLARGAKTAVSLLRSESSLKMAAHFHDCLGWDNFVEGRIWALWVEIRAQEIHTRGLQRGADFWARGLMHWLLKLTHCQWLYRNATVHMKVKDGMTAAQHNLIFSRMEECLLIDPAYLLVEDRQLLNADFDQLIRGPTLDKLEWLAEMDSA